MDQALPSPAAADSRDLWIVIPAYNAEATVGAVARAARHSGLPVLVVDDGSSDGTGHEAEAAGVAVLRLSQNLGKGGALRSGFAYALHRGARAVLTLDADGQHDPAEIPALRAAHLREPQALIIGARSFDPALMPRRSRVGNHISTFFISLFAGQRFRDTQSGFRVYPAQLLRRAPLRACRFEIETELLLWGSKLGVPVREVSIATIYHRAPAPATEIVTAEGAAPAHRTHFRNVHDTLRILRLVIGSPLWRAPQPPSEPMADAAAALSQPKMEAT